MNTYENHDKEDTVACVALKEMETMDLEEEDLEEDCLREGRKSVWSHLVVEKNVELSLTQQMRTQKVLASQMRKQKVLLQFP